MWGILRKMVDLNGMFSFRPKKLCVCILFRIESSCIQVTIVDFTKEHLRILERKMQSLPKKKVRLEGSKIYGQAEQR